MANQRNYNAINVIGDTETIRDASFYTRFGRGAGEGNPTPGPPEKQGINENKRCARATVKYEWAEYKTSLLVQDLSQDRVVHNRLLEFLRQIGIRIHQRTRIDRENRLSRYITGRRNGTITEHYPVAQDTVLITNNLDVNGDIVDRDFYIQMNYLKQLSSWIQNKKAGFDNPVSVEMAGIINQVRERMNEVVEAYKGARDNRVAGYTPAERGDTQVGITNIRDPYLTRDLSHLGAVAARVQPQGWIHPGESKCRQPYRGKYGQLIREDRGRQGFFGSTKCGISGSVNFLLYVYLMSIYDNPLYIIQNTDTDIDNMILSCCLYLAGDGGHTVREIFCGLMHSCIILDRLRIEYANLGLPAELVTLYRKFFTGNVTTFLTAFCNRFANINITGVVEADLPQDVRDNTDARFRAYTIVMFRVFFAGDRNVPIPNVPYLLQLYFTLDRHRYRNNNFLESPSQILGEIIERVGGNIITRVNARLQARLDECGIRRPPAAGIPFAFKAKSAKKAKRSKRVKRVKKSIKLKKK
jgi:hypothetical protein